MKTHLAILLQEQAAAAGLGIFLILVIIAFSAFFYFLPSIIGRNKTNIGAIFVLNLLLGWTLVGWVVALVWAVSKDNQPIQVNTVIEHERDKSDKPDKFDKLSKLKTLFDSQAITETEYNSEKEKILRS